MQQSSHERSHLSQSVILQQVTNGIAVRMAVLALSMQGQLQEKGLLDAIAV